MRSPALALLVAASGCNWVFDLQPTVSRDGGGDDAPDAPPSIRDRLVWGVAATDNTGAPVAPVYKAIGSESTRDTVPIISVGEPLGGMAPMPSAYDITDGSFEVPYTLREAPHRIIYRLPGDNFDHEIQWSITGAVIVIPRTTRYDAPLVPTGSGFTFTPTGLGGSVPGPTILTTGVATYDNRASKFTQTGPNVVYDFDANALPLTSPLGGNQATDYIVYGDRAPRMGSQLALNGYAITHIELLAGGPTTAQTQPAWMTGSAADRQLQSTCGSVPADCIPTIDAGGAIGRFANAALGVLSGTTKTQSLQYGISPTTKLPGFVPGAAPDYVDKPTILPFLVSSSVDSVLLVADPTKTAGVLPFERVITASVYATRVVDGAPLTSSIQAITSSFTGPLLFKAPLALAPKLGANALGAADNVTINASSQPTALTWDEETAGAADDYVVTLYQITNNRLATVRVYHVLTSSVTVDGSLLAPGSKYVFAITSRNGLSKAKQGNYGADTVLFPFSEATTFASAFTVQ